MSSRSWTFFTNHGFVLMVVARRPDLKLKEVAEEVGITLRQTQAIVGDLVEAGYLERRREGRRNRYVVHGDRPLRHRLTEAHNASDVLRALESEQRIGPADAPLRAVALACSDHRYQEPLRDLLAAEGLLGGAEILLWPGGSAALAGPDAGPILAAMAVGTGTGAPSRVVLVAHEGCRVPGAHVARRVDPFTTRHAVNARRQVAVSKVRRLFGVEPELWFLTSRGARRVRSPRSPTRSLVRVP